MLDYKGIVEAAFEARRNSYAPYSHYRVGAALLCKDGTIVKGCNIENASYGLSNCAERTAVFKAVSEGKTRFEAIAVVGGSDDTQAKDYAYPCGACRQVLREFYSPEQLRVIVAKSVDDYREYRLSELLPDSFGPDSLV